MKNTKIQLNSNVFQNNESSAISTFFKKFCILKIVSFKEIQNFKEHENKNSNFSENMKFILSAKFMKKFKITKTG